MTEYDYSPDAYERYMATQARISNWVSDANQHAREFVDPIHAPPHRRKSSFYNQASSSGSDESVHRRPEYTTRSHTALSSHHRPDYHRSRSSKSHRFASRPASPTASSSCSSSSSSSFSVVDHKPINPYNYAGHATSPRYPDAHHPTSFTTKPVHQSSLPLNQPVRPHQDRSRSGYAPQSIPIHAPTPIRVPYGAVQGAEMVLPPGQKYKVVDTKRVEHLKPPSHHSSAYAYSKPHSSSRPPIYSQPSGPYASPPIVVASSPYHYQSPQPPNYFPNHPPAHIHHHPPHQPPRPLLQKVMGSFQKHSDSGRRHSRRDY